MKTASVGRQPPNLMIDLVILSTLLIEDCTCLSGIPLYGKGALQNTFTPI